MDIETCRHLFVHNVCAGLLAVSRSKAGSLLLRSQVRKGLESLILTATSGAIFSVLFPLKSAPESRHTLI